MTRLTRREWMARPAGGLLAAGLWPGWLTARDADTDPFRFVVVNDLHVVDEKCQPWFDNVVKSMAGTKPAFVLVVGDLSEDGTAPQLGRAKAVLSSLTVPAYAVPGNHDHQKPADRKVYDDLFPKQLNYAFDHGGWQFVALDTTEGTKYEKVTAGKPTLDFLDATLPKLDSSKPTVLFTHFPLGRGVKMRLTNADALLDRFKPFNLKAVFNGHYHAFTENKARETVVTTNRCCAHARHNHDGTKEKGYFVVDAKDGRLSRSFVEVKVG
jgi:3',5'-cyclic AMP phosphodiesterase CpdA